MGHVIEVLTGAETEKVRKWNHSSLSTYGIGQEYSRPEWGAIGRELMRLGFVRQNAERFNVLELTETGWAILRKRTPVILTKPVSAPRPAAARVGEIVCDDVLFEQLRLLRRNLADERAVPAFIVFSDVALRQMAREYPTTETAFSQISGVGEKKLREFGETFLAEIILYLRTNPRQKFT
jgi:ATP-dependent DNA helicase RecQ